MSENNISFILILCLTPLAAIFVVIKLALWISETASYRAETEKLKRMQRGPYEVWDDKQEEMDEW
tara:strand:+ start:252 stop:446 length:195 start_codon:yes stop_codon:yes gene_type:complete